MMWTVNPVMKPKRKIILFKDVVVLHELSSWEKNRQLQIILVFNVVESWNVYCWRKFFFFLVLPSIDFCFDWWPHIQSLFHVFYNEVHLTVIAKIGTENPVKSWLEQKFICEDVLVLHEPSSSCHWEKNRQLQIILKIQR